MIDKIHFSVSIFIYMINALICILYYNIKCVEINDYNLSKEYISQKDLMDQISLAYSIFLLIFCLIYVVIYQEIYGRDMVRDLFINVFYILLSTNVLYLNYKNFQVIKTEEKSFSKVLWDIPIYPLERIMFFLCIIQGFVVLLISFTLIKLLISYYRGLKILILTYFQNGGRVLSFEFRHLIN